MRPVSDVTRTPFRWVCRVVAKTQQGYSIGTAILISPWHALTAAHVIYPIQEPYQTIAISVSPGYSTSSKPVYDANGWAVNPSWNARDCRTDGFDWGVIRLAKPVASALGYWNLSSFAPSSLPGTAVMIAGYPGRREDREATQMFQSNGSLKGSPSITRCTRTIADGTLVPITPTSLLIAHDAASESSMSGGPVWLEGPTSSLVAIHVGMIGNGQFKKAVLLSQGTQASIRDLMNRSLRPLARA